MQPLWIAAFVVQWVMVIALTILVAGMLRRLAVMQERWELAAPPISMYEVGQVIKEFALPDASGTTRHSRDLLARSDNGVVVLFLSATCSSCTMLLAQAAELVARVGDSMRMGVAIVVLGTSDGAAQVLSTQPSLHHDAIVVLNDESGQVGHQFGIRSVPTGIVLDRYGHVTKQTFNPHASNWLYAALGASVPADPVSSGAPPVVVPAAYLQRRG